MTVAITGGGGFIGQATVDAILASSNEKVIVFDRRDGNDILGPLDALHGADAVIHLAGLLGTHELFDAVQPAIDTNITGSYRIMDWCIKNDANYVGIMMPDVFPSVYTATKVASKRLADALHHSRGLACSHVRAFNVFGPGQAHGPGHPQKIIPTFAVAGWNRQPMPIWGSGEQTVDLISAEDVGHLLYEASSCNNNEVFDAGTGQPFTVNEVAAMIMKITGSTVAPQHLPMRDGELPTTVVATGDGWEELARVPTFNYVDLEKTVVWYRDNG
jgi:UDP-glucose 4-epimerase